LSVTTSSREKLQIGEIKLILNSENDAYSEEEEVHETPVSPSRAATSPQLQRSSNWGPPSGTKGCPHFYKTPSWQEAPHTNSGSSPLEVFMLFFAGVIQLLVVETHRYYQLYLDKLEGRHSPLPDVTGTEMFLFQALILKMGHVFRDRVTDS
jgi:hypothetical protein